MIIKWLQSKIAKVFYGAFLGLLLSGLLGAFPNTALAACSGNACNGKDPNVVGCTMISTLQQLDKPAPTGHVELRKSTSCNAKWAKTTNTSGAARYTAATDWWPPYAFPANLTYSASSAAPIANGATVYSFMLGPSYAVQACGDVNTAFRIPVPIPQNTGGYCTIFDGN